MTVRGFSQRLPGLPGAHDFVSSTNTCLHIHTSPMCRGAPARKRQVVSDDDDEEMKGVVGSDFSVFGCVYILV